MGAAVEGPWVTALRHAGDCRLVLLSGLVEVSNDISDVRQRLSRE